MEFIAIIVVLCLLQYRGGEAPLQADGWFFNWVNGLSRGGLLSVSSIGNILVAAGLPALVILALDLAAKGQGLGLPTLLLNIVVLSYSLGRGNLSKAVEQYSEALERGDFQSAYKRLNTYLRGSEPNVTDPASLHQMARSVLFYRGFERLFAVLFWFLLLGPAAALFYRLTFLYRYRVLKAEDPQLQRITRALYVLEWLPVRALGFSFSILGNFSNGMKVLLGSFFDFKPSSQQLVNDLGVAALCWESACERLKTPLNLEEGRHFVQQSLSDLKAIHNLLSRSVMLWVGILAILMILL